MNNPKRERFIGNRLSSSLDLIGPDRKTLRQKYDIVEPFDCPLGSAEEMKRRGFVGIYLKEVRRRTQVCFVFCPAEISCEEERTK